MIARDDRTQPSADRVQSQPQAPSEEDGQERGDQDRQTQADGEQRDEPAADGLDSLDPHRRHEPADRLAVDVVEDHRPTGQSASDLGQPAGRARRREVRRKCGRGSLIAGDSQLARPVEHRAVKAGHTAGVDHERRVEPSGEGQPDRAARRGIDARAGPVAQVDLLEVDQVNTVAEVGVGGARRGTIGAGQDPPGKRGQGRCLGGRTTHDLLVADDQADGVDLALVHLELDDVLADLVEREPGDLVLEERPFRVAVDRLGQVRGVAREDRGHPAHRGVGLGECLLADHPFDGGQGRDPEDGQRQDRHHDQDQDDLATVGKAAAAPARAARHGDGQPSATSR